MGVVEQLSDYQRPQIEAVERRVADLEDGFTRLANVLLEATMASGFSETELCIVLAVWRKTYGYGKKMDWLSNEQLEQMILKHYTHCSTAKNLLIEKGVLLQEGRKVGMNTNVSEWKTKFNGFCKTLAKSAKKETLAKPAKKSLAEVANRPLQKLLTTKENIQKKKEKIPPNPPRGDSEAAQRVLDYYNSATGSRCSATAVFEKTLNTVKSKGQCYSEDEIMLVIRWASEVWKFKPKPENICRMTRFDSYLSDALIWEGGEGRNPEACPHDQLIALWNTIVPERAIEPNEWVKTRPAYRNLERVWNLKNNKGNWRNVSQMKTLFTLIHQSSLFVKSEEKPWLNLDWILQPARWSSVYEQAKSEYLKSKPGVPA